MREVSIEEIPSRLALPMAVWDVAGNIVDANESFFALLGVASTDGEPLNYWEVTAPAQKQRELNLLLSSDGTYEKEFVTRDGEAVTVRADGGVIERGADERFVFGALFHRIRRDEHDPAERERRLRRHNELLLGLTESDALGRGELDRSLREITEAAAAGLGVSRVSVWFYDEGRTSIVCRDLFQAGEHSAGVELRASDFPAYFAALADDRTITADDARSHPATREFTEIYLKPLDIHAMLEAPIRHKGRLVGVLCHEQCGRVRRWTQDDVIYAASLADFVGRALDADERRRAEEALLARQRLEQELAIARRIQRFILPTQLDVKHLEIAAAMLTAEEVGGDYYDVLPVEGGAWLGIGDVSGHGINAGLIMMMVQAGVASLVQGCADTAPSRVLQHLNHVVHQNIRERLELSDHMTLTLVRYFEDGRIVFAGAHEVIVVVHADGAVTRLPTPGTWVGARRSIAGVTRDSSYQLRDGDVVVLYSDGVTEAFGPDREQYGLGRLSEVVRAHRDLPSGDIVRRILDDVGAWTTDLTDDISVLVARFAPNASKG
jgi:serine phosphatase RsbU (regulator of sigma subunit)